MTSRGGGHVISTGSIAGLEPYEGGSVYCASKHALHAFMKSLRYETHKSNIRCTVVAPGLVGEGTEFSEVRFKGDKSTAAATYVNMQAFCGYVDALDPDTL
jgi:3-hydroxy acid dehydrogenase / malonic semialdehyde reductase